MMDKVFEKKELATCFEQWSAHLRPNDLPAEEVTNQI
jgi:hypothetical protein